MRYFLLKDENTLSVYLSEDLQTQPINSLPFEANDLINARFDQYPNPTKLIEGDPLPIEVPQVITRRQFKIALAVLGKNEQDILNGINQLPEPNKTIAMISYTEAGTFERNNPELIFVAKTFLQMTDEQIDEVFIIGNNY